jgi:hypothetical protein
MKAKLSAIVLALVVLPGAALAGNPTTAVTNGFQTTFTPGVISTQPGVNTPHPTMPWAGITNQYGQPVRYFLVPSQPVEIQSPGASATGETVLEARVVDIPGYTMTETNVGFYVPERWIIEQVGPGSYQWRVVPPQFFRK